MQACSTRTTRETTRGRRARQRCENYEFCIKNEKFCIKITPKRRVLFQNHPSERTFEFKMMSVLDTKVPPLRGGVSCRCDFSLFSHRFSLFFHRFSLFSHRFSLFFHRFSLCFTALFHFIFRGRAERGPLLRDRAHYKNDAFCI